jgi:hypothetical protein
MRKHIIGGLCIVAFIAAIASNLAVQTLDAKSKSSPKREVRPTTVSVVCTTADQDKAVSLEVISMKGCGPCARLKPILKDLILDGYDITIVDISKDTRGTTAAPSLYFLDEDGEVVMKAVGFKEASWIKKYLSKCP